MTEGLLDAVKAANHNIRQIALSWMEIMTDRDCPIDVKIETFRSIAEHAQQAHDYLVSEATNAKRRSLVGSHALICDLSDRQLIMLADIVEHRESLDPDVLTMRMHFRKWRDLNGLRCEWCHDHSYKRDHNGNPIHNSRCPRGSRP